MVIHTIWVMRKDEDQAELIDSWDDASVDSNPEGFDEKVGEASRNPEYTAVRVILIALPTGDIERAFAPKVSEGKVIEP